jgi:hypothetical protein
MVASLAGAVHHEGAEGLHQQGMAGRRSWPGAVSEAIPTVAAPRFRRFPRG